MTVRTTLAAHLFGNGVEIGAEDLPVDTRGNTKIQNLRRVDRYRKRDLLQKMPELTSASHNLVEPEIVYDVSDGLPLFRNESLDFIINCHLVEHVPDPIFFMEEIWRVLKFGGHCYLAAPDKDFLAFDMKRPLTRLSHLIEDNRRSIRVVEDHHMVEFLTLSENLTIPSDPIAREELFARHRERSIHIHVWNYQSFCEFLFYFVTQRCAFNAVEASPPKENERREILFLLKKVRKVSDTTRRLLSAKT